uniref:Uncharacterized protein n=1 Tax=Zea mays TaxID=4577 RepID=B4FKN7_MAIZE|nr:unknown [Zea mays]|eukprot:NP_001136807.1 uncharacterized protein LOC100216953 [Zea mays]
MRSKSWDPFLSWDDIQYNCLIVFCEGAWSYHEKCFQPPSHVSQVVSSNYRLDWLSKCRDLLLVTLPLLSGLRNGNTQLLLGICWVYRLQTVKPS